MLSHLHIEHFALIDDLDCTFNNNFNVIIGETGAGKSILMQAISMLTGGKSAYEKIRNGFNNAYIEGEFILNEHDFEKLNQEYADYINQKEIIISRYLDIKGKTIQRINGKSVNLNIIKAISKTLIDIHSPNEELFFYDEKKQLDILDNFILKNKNKSDLMIYENYQKSYKHMLEIENKIQKTENLLTQKNDIDYLKYQQNELNSAAIKEHELEDLESKYASLGALVNISEKLESFFNESKIGLEHIFHAKRELENIHDDSFQELKEKYIDCYYNLDETNAGLMDHFQDLLKDASQIEVIKDRLFFLRSLKRKYGSSTAEILAKQKDIENTLLNIEEADFNLKKYQKEKEDFLPYLLKDGEKLNDVRKKYARILEQTLDNELKELLFENAHFKIHFTSIDYNQTGIYKISFLLSANKGMEALPLKASISLGESSRLLLAFKKVFFDYEHLDTLIFDEIDIGISGKAALSVGNKIKEIAKNCQVITISHLGQVACKGDHFYLVKKESNSNTTVSKIINLDQENAIKEIAKMINNGIEDKTSYQLVKSWLKENTK